MKKKKNTSLLSLINSQIDLWKPSEATIKNNKTQAKEELEQSKLIADKLYKIHALVGEQSSYKIFGYGSLLNRRSRSRTMTPKSVTYGRVKGYKRIYNLLIAQGTCLNVEPSEDSEIDGAICKIDKKDMLNFILREFNYDIIPVTTTDGDPVFMVMANQDEGQTVATNDPPSENTPDTEQLWQKLLPRLDYIQACYNGVYELSGDDNIFLTKDNVLFNDTTLMSFINTVCPTVTTTHEDGTVISTNSLLNYWQTIDSAY